MGDKGFSYDGACETLARHFLPDNIPDRMPRELAQVIQDCVENWLEAERDRLRASIGIGESEKPQ
jgi:hypothetical protein